MGNAINKGFIQFVINSLYKYVITRIIRNFNMLLNLNDEQNLILSFKQDMSKPGYPKEDLYSEINTILKRNYLSEENAEILQTMLANIAALSASNENSACRA